MNPKIDKFNFNSSMDTSVIQKVEKFVKEKMAGNDPSHDWLHVERVRRTALQLASEINSIIRYGQYTVDQIVSPHFSYASLGHIAEVDLVVVEVAALLHDVIDPKYYTGSADEALNLIKEFLATDAVTKEQQEAILKIIRNMSYREELKNPEIFKTLSDDCSFLLAFACVQDADRIDAIGAMGVARCFAFGATKSTPFYLGKGDELRTDISFEEYSTKKSASIVSHFYEKLFKLKDLMKTASGHAVAAKRTEFMACFIDSFNDEAGLEYIGL